MIRRVLSEDEYGLLVRAYNDLGKTGSMRVDDEGDILARREATGRELHYGAVERDAIDDARDVLAGWFEVTPQVQAAIDAELDKRQRVGPARILVIEDDPAVGRALKRALKRPDVYVHVTPSLEGAEILLHHGWDLVISDLEVEGGTTERLLVNHHGGHRWPVPVIVHSGSEIPARLRGIALAVFAKPADMRELAEVAYRAIRFTRSIRAL